MSTLAIFPFVCRKRDFDLKYYRYILQPYDLNHRLDNSILQVTLNITLKEGDTIFQRPLTRMQPILLPGEEEKRRNNSLPNPGMNNTLSIPTAGKIVYFSEFFDRLTYREGFLPI